MLCDNEMTFKLITEISNTTQYSQTSLTEVGLEQIKFHTNGIDVSHDEIGNTILSITEMGIEIFSLILTPQMRDVFVSMIIGPDFK